MDPLTSIVAALHREQIIPDVIPPSAAAHFEPSVLFSVVWRNGKEVTLGSSTSPTSSIIIELTQVDTLDEPDVSFRPMVLHEAGAKAEAEADSEAETLSTSASIAAVTEEARSYTLVMTDPDAPSRQEPQYREFRHWVITGLKATAETRTSSNATGAIATKMKPSTTPYRPPGPRPGSGVHRYTFLLFQEPPSGVNIPHGALEYGSALEERRSWSAMAFAEQYDLKLVGASFFLLRSQED